LIWGKTRKNEVTLLQENKGIKGQRVNRLSSTRVGKGQRKEEKGKIGKIMSESRNQDSLMRVKRPFVP